MKKFSHISSINESTENTFLLQRNVDDELPESYMETLDMIATLKESYSDTIERVVFEKGYVTDYNSIREDRPAHATQIINMKKIKQFFKDGNIPDKWCLAIKLLIEFKRTDKVKKVFDPSILDAYIARYKSIKTLTSRCDYYGAKCQISFGTTMNDENISLLIFFK